MKLKITYKYVLTFLALTFLMHELHEIVHISVGRLICGCWGTRDFNIWSLCGNCDKEKPYSTLATFAGPIFTFMVIWIGTFIMIRAKSQERKAIGFSLIFANIPFARIFGAATGGGDEVWGLNLILQNQPIAWIIGLIIVVSVTAYPLYKGFQIIGNESPIVWLLVFFMIPTYIDQWVVLLLMNALLKQGVLSDYWIIGSPALVTVWTVFLIVFVWVTKNNIFDVVDNGKIKSAARYVILK